MQQDPVADLVRHRYHRPMRHTYPLMSLLLGLCLLGIVTTGVGHIGWMLYLIVVPAGLIGMLWGRWSWAGMACVIYGTVGLALDLATTVQILTKDQPTFGALATSGISGLLNFLLILFGGRSFLNYGQEPPPPGSHPPSPPSPASSAAT